MNQRTRIACHRPGEPIPRIWFSLAGWLAIPLPLIYLWGSWLFFLQLLCLAVIGIVVPRWKPDPVTRQVCAIACLGVSIACAGVVFVGWQEPTPFDLYTLRFSGFPIPGVRRLCFHRPPGTPITGSVDSCFPGLTRDLLVLELDIALCILIATVAVRRVPQLSHRWAQLLYSLLVLGFGTAMGMYLGSTYYPEISEFWPR